jgi:alkylation response protein AidB-like acyl-CoA dehydrogenase
VQHVTVTDSRLSDDEQGPTITVEEFATRAEAWLAANTSRYGPDEDLGEMARHRRTRELQRELAEAGLIGITWPAAYGGQGLTEDHQRCFDHLAERYDFQPVSSIGLGMCGPTILQAGSEEQRRRYIRPLLRGDEWWCQLFSEPSAGSDLANLRTSAVRDGDEWVVDGQKVWTSGAHLSDLGLLLARTDPRVPKHRGLTMFVLDMRSEGVTVRPLRQATGAAEFNEVFFDQVRIPADGVIGEVGGGWANAVRTLMNERVSIGTGGSTQRMLGCDFPALLGLARRRGVTGDPIIRQQLATVYIAEQLMGYTAARQRAGLLIGRTPGPEGSTAKLATAILARTASDIGLRIAGARGQAWTSGDADGDAWAMAAIRVPYFSIGGGTDEIQRNIIGERVLGLPPEPRVDRTLPFDQIPGT